MAPSDLRAARRRLGMRQIDLAEALGVSRRTIIEREYGRVPITRETELALRWLLAQSSPHENLPDQD